MKPTPNNGIEGRTTSGCAACCPPLMPNVGLQFAVSLRNQLLFSILTEE